MTSMAVRLGSYAGWVYDSSGWKSKGFGYYHLSNDAAEDTTWYDFAVEILKDSDVEVVPVDSSKFPAKAKTSPQLNQWV